MQPVEFFRIIRVTVFIADINDNAPRFSDSRLVFDVLETAVAGTGLVIPGAIDVDGPRYAVTRYGLSTDSGPFDLREIRRGNESVELRLVLRDTLDRESIASYDLSISAVDGGLPPLSGSVAIHINVVDVNDNSPVFETDSYSVSVAENTAVNTTLMTVRAFDADEGLSARVVYELPSSMTLGVTGQRFAVNNVTGDVIVMEAFDYEESSVYHLVVMARDLGPDAVPSTVSVTVNVEDVNDNAPEIAIDTLSAVPGAADIDEHYFIILW